MRTIILFTILLISSGCKHESLRDFDHPGNIMVKNNALAMIMVNRDGELILPGSHDYKIDPQQSVKLRETLTSQCGLEEKPIEDKTAPVIIPIIVAVGKLIFDQSVENSNRELIKIKKAAVRSSSSRSILSYTQLKEHMCMVIIRDEISNIPEDIDEDSGVIEWDLSKSGLIIILKKEEYASGFTYKPSYIKAKNTIALTKRGDEKSDDPKVKNARIDLAIAISLKAISKDGKSLPRLNAFGEGVTSITSIPLIDKEDNQCVREGRQICHATDLLPYPDNNGQDDNGQNSPDYTHVSLTIAVTETGVVGFDIDQAISENKALKEALGPAIGDSLKELLTEDD